VNSLFTVFDPVLFIISPLLEVLKIIVSFLLPQVFIFIVKTIFASGTFRVIEKQKAKKGVDKWLAQGKVSEARKLAKKLLSEGKILEAKELVIMEYFKDLSYSL